MYGRDMRRVPKLPILTMRAVSPERLCPTERAESPGAHSPMLGHVRQSQTYSQCWPCCLGNLAMLGNGKPVADVGHAADGREPWPCGGGRVLCAESRGEGGPAQPGQRKRTPHKNFFIF